VGRGNYLMNLRDWSPLEDLLSQDRVLLDLVLYVATILFELNSLVMMRSPCLDWVAINFPVLFLIFIGLQFFLFVLLVYNCRIVLRWRIGYCLIFWILVLDFLD